MFNKVSLTPMNNTAFMSKRVPARKRAKEEKTGRDFQEYEVARGLAQEAVNLQGKVAKAHTHHLKNVEIIKFEREMQKRLEKEEITIDHLNLAQQMLENKKSIESLAGYYIEGVIEKSKPREIPLMTAEDRMYTEGFSEAKH